MPECRYFRSFSVKKKLHITILGWDIATGEMLQCMHAECIKVLLNDVAQQEHSIGEMFP
jgi:hypothetical protein